MITQRRYQLEFILLTPGKVPQNRVYYDAIHNK